MEMRAATTSPVSEPSLRISTRSLAVDCRAHLAQHDDLAGVDVGCDHSIASDSDAITRQADGALDPAVDVERFRASHLALDHQRLADGGLVRSSGGGALPRDAAPTAGSLAMAGAFGVDMVGRSGSAGRPGV